jgi:hypothetical protein
MGVLVTVGAMVGGMLVTLGLVEAAIVAAMVGLGWLTIWVGVVAVLHAVRPSKADSSMSLMAIFSIFSLPHGVKKVS